MSNIGRSDKWKQNEVRRCLDQLLKANPQLYETVTDTTGFAYWFNVLCLLAGHSMWSIEDVQNYLRTGSEDRQRWVQQESGEGGVVYHGQWIGIDESKITSSRNKQWSYRDCVMGFVSEGRGLEFKCSDKQEGDDCVAQVLRRFGAEGWELCAVKTDLSSGFGIYYFKKERTDAVAG